MSEWTSYKDDGLHHIVMPDGRIVRFLTLDDTGIQLLMTAIQSMVAEIDRLRAENEKLGSQLKEALGINDIAIERNVDLKQQNAKLVELVENLIEDSPCEIDGYGLCQAHCYHEKPETGDVMKYLAAITDKDEGK